VAAGQHGELDMADGPIDGLAKKVEMEKLLDALPTVLRHRLTEDLRQQTAPFRQGQEEGIPGIGDVVGEEDVGDAALDLDHFAFVHEGIDAGVKDPEKALVGPLQNASGQEAVDGQAPQPGAMDRQGGDPVLDGFGCRGLGDPGQAEVENGFVNRLGVNQDEVVAWVGVNAPQQGEIHEGRPGEHGTHDRETDFGKVTTFLVMGQQQEFLGEGQHGDSGDDQARAGRVWARVLAGRVRAPAAVSGGR
jgi:hypothetical protein